MSQAEAIQAKVWDIFYAPKAGYSEAPIWYIKKLLVRSTFYLFYFETQTFQKETTNIQYYKE